VTGGGLTERALALWQVLKSKTLPELVQRSNELSVEIKELDSDMQMLVYENYNKFISATETIQDMKTKVDGMEGEMGRLATAVSEITGTPANPRSYASLARPSSRLLADAPLMLRLRACRSLCCKVATVFSAADGH